MCNYCININFLGERGTASQWRACYQQGLLRLVEHYLVQNKAIQIVQKRDSAGHQNETISFKAS